MKRKLIVLIIGLTFISVLNGCGNKNEEYAQPDIIVEEKVEKNIAVIEEQSEEPKHVVEQVADVSWSDPCPDAVQLTDEVFKAYATADWQLAFKEILDATYEGNRFTKEGVTEAWYYLYDIDKDEIPELMIKQGADENSYMTDVYYWDGSEAKHAGDTYSGRLNYYSDPADNGVIEYSLHMGYGVATRLSLIDGKLITGDSPIFEDDMMSKYVMDMEPDPIAVSDEIEGAKPLKGYCPKCVYPLLAYTAPIYAAGREALTDDEFKAAIEGIIDDGDEFYWVTTENTTLQDCTFKTNKIDWSYFMDGTALFSNPNEEVIYIKNRFYADFNGDGFTECLIELRNTAGTLALALMSYQHGNIYAYTSQYMGDWSLEVEGDKIYASGFYDQGMEISYLYCLDQAKIHIDKNERVILSADAMDDLNDYFRNELKQGDYKLGVAFIGCAGNYAGETLMDLFEETRHEREDLNFMQELGKCHVVKEPGEEVYVLVPADEKYVINVYDRDWGDYDPDLYPKRGELRYTGAPGEIVIVRCNQSDIMSNVEVSMDMDGTEFVYNPSMSLENGRLEEVPEVYDFSVYNGFYEDEESEWDE